MQEEYSYCVCDGDDCIKRNNNINSADANKFENKIA